MYLIFNYGRPYPAVYIIFVQNTHQIQVLTKPLCHAQAIFLCAAEQRAGYQLSWVDLQREANCPWYLYGYLSQAKLVCQFGHRPVIVKMALIGSKGGWKLSTIFLSCKVFHDWSIIKLRKYIVFIRWVYLCCTFWNNISLLLLIKFTGRA